MQDQPTSAGTREHATGRAIRIALPILMLAVAVTIGAVLLKTPPQVPKTDPSPVRAVVGVAPLELTSQPVFINAFGTVVAARDVRIQPEVDGRVVALHASLMPGGLLTEGETLFEIDPANYEIAVAQASADLDVARLRVEQLRAGVESLRSQAQEIEAELQYLGWNAQRLAQLTEGNAAGQSEARDAQSQFASKTAALAALRAQVAEREASVKAASAEVLVAESRLAAANLALERTKVRVPFNAVVLRESVELGQLVNPQTTVATLAATDAFRVEAAIPIARLPDIRFAVNDPETASTVRVTLATGEEPFVREGVALCPLGDLDPQGRMARVLISIQDPLLLDPQDDANAGARPLLLGSYVRLAITAGRLDDVYIIPRLALRENSRVWVRDKDGALAIRDVHVVWRRQSDVLVRNDFAAGDHLVVTHLASVVPGMPLDVREDNVAMETSTTTAPTDRS